MSMSKPRRRRIAIPLGKGGETAAGHKRIYTSTHSINKIHPSTSDRDSTSFRARQLGVPGAIAGRPYKLVTLIRYLYLRTPPRTSLLANKWRVLDISTGEQFPLRLMRVAIRPATWGAAIDVPDNVFVAYKKEGR